MAHVPETIFGDQEIGDGDHDGYRTAMGMWLDCQHRWGLEADYFDVTGKPNNYDSGSTDGFDANGNGRLRSCGSSMIRQRSPLRVSHPIT